MTSLSFWLTLLLVMALIIALFPVIKKNRQTDPMDEESSQALTEKTQTSKQKKITLAAIVFIPVFSAGVYFAMGTPQFAEVATAKAPPEQTDLVAKLEEKLTKKPNDLDGWLLLGRSYLTTEDYTKAIQAFEKALTLNPNRLDAILPLADSIAITQAGRLSGKPYQLLQKAYELDPQNQMTLWLLGMAEKQKGDYKQAESYWQTLYSLLPKNSEDRKKIGQFLASIGGVLPIEESPEANTLASNKTSEAFEGLKIQLSFDNETLNKLNNKTLFVYAKAVSGMPMPIAAKKLSGNNLPAEFTLTAKDQLMPNRKLTDFRELTIGIKVSDVASQGATSFQSEQNAKLGDTLKFIIKL